MESTEMYYVPVYNALEGFISNVVVANPKQVKAIKGEKSDNKEARWIADLFKMGLVRSSYIPSKDFRILREFTRYHYKFTNAKSSLEDILSSVGGIQFTNKQKLRTNIVKDHINVLVKPYESYIDLLCTIPGIDRNSAIGILSEISNDISQFKSLHRLTSWTGLASGCNESVDKKKSVKISRAGVYLKPYLVEITHSSVKDKTNSYYVKKFKKISKRRGKKRAYIAIARKILVAIYYMLETGEVWNHIDLAYVETPVEDKIKYTKNNFNQSLKLLLSSGLTSEELINLINQNANKFPV